MFRIGGSSAEHVLPGLFRIFIIIAVAAYGAAVVRNITEVLHDIAHQQAPIQVAQRPAR
nr:hypothetical protein [uncultured Rhodopila sp.]